MAPPPVTIYVTSLTSQPRVRKNIELLHRALGGFEIPYETFDLATDEDAKRRWQRAKPTGQVIGLPGYLVGGEFIGTMDDFEEAVETGKLEKFLMQDRDMADSSQTIGEDELDKLMREMTTADLDKLMGDLPGESSAAAAPAASKSATTTGGSVLNTLAEKASEAVSTAQGAVAAVLPSAASASDKPSAELVAEQTDKPEGPKPGEKTLDDVIDETLAKEKKDDAKEAPKESATAAAA